MTLLPTQTAPKLSLPLTGAGTTDDLFTGSAEAGRFTAVFFFRGLHCPICRKQLAEINKRLGDLSDAGIGKVVAVSMETEPRSAELVDTWGLENLPVAHSLDEETARQWGLYISGSINEGEPEVFSEPGVFIFDSDGSLFWSSIATMPFGRPALDDIIAGVRFAQEHNYPARGAA
ncbi:redoxin domain-containing protein [Arthrobacter monumenti]